MKINFAVHKIEESKLEMGLNERSRLTAAILVVVKCLWHYFIRN